MTGNISVDVYGHGKCDNSRNATKHGVLSTQLVLSWEDEGEFRMLLDAIISEHQPVGPTQGHLVQELAAVIWRKKRLHTVEAAIFGETYNAIGAVDRALSYQYQDPNKMQLMARYETHLDRKLERVLALLCRLKGL